MWIAYFRSKKEIQLHIILTKVERSPQKKVTDLVRMGMSRPNSTHHNWPSTQRPIMYNKHKKGYLQRSLFDLAAINESMQRPGLFGRRMYYVNPFKRTI